MTTADHIQAIRDQGFCVLPGHFPHRLIRDCRDAFWPVLLAYLQAHAGEPNRGPYRHFLPMPFEPPCFVPEFFFDTGILRIVRGLMGDQVVADQWSCDVPLRGSDYQEVHADYRRPLFEEAPDLPLPAYQLVVSFGLVRIGPEHGPIEMAPGTHRMPRAQALRAVQASEIVLRPVPLAAGDVLIRHPWVLHRGTPNTTDTPRALASIRYVRPWYADHSREVSAMGRATWRALTPGQQGMLRFPVET